MLQDIKSDCESRMTKSLDALRQDLARLRTGRANPNLLEPVMVEYYGQPTALNQVANVSVVDARTLLITPWEKNIIPEVEKAISKANLGVNPVTVGAAIRVPLPPLTEERRKDMIRVVKKEAENARVAIRNIRRDANTQFKDLLKAKDISEDEEHRYQDVIQDVTNKFIGEVDKVLTTKESELMEF